MSVEAREGLEIVEEVDGVIVVEEVRSLPERRSVGQIVSSRGAMAATGFVAGAATAVVVAHRRARRAAPRAARRAKNRNGSSGTGLDIAATRSFLVDVHLLNKRP